MPTLTISLDQRRRVAILNDVRVDARPVEQLGDGGDCGGLSGAGCQNSRAAAGMADMAGRQQGGGLGGDPGSGPFRPDHGDDPLQIAEPVLQGEHQAVLGHQPLSRCSGLAGGPGLGAEQDQIGLPAVVRAIGQGPDPEAAHRAVHAGEGQPLPVDGSSMARIGGEEAHLRKRRQQGPEQTAHRPGTKNQYLHVTTCLSFWPAVLPGLFLRSVAGKTIGVSYKPSTKKVNAEHFPRLEESKGLSRRVQRGTVRPLPW